MGLTLGTASSGSLSMGTNTGMQGSTASPQRTTSPQQSVSGSSLQPTTNPFGLYTSGGGGTNTNYNLTAGTGATGATGAAADPYAKWGGRAGYDNVLNDYYSQRDNAITSANDAAKTSGIGLRDQIADFIDSLTTGQQSVDNRGINNELARQRGTSDIYGSVGRNIRSAGVTLANRNAVDSSAAEAFARAYGDQGRRALSDVNNQYETENTNIGLAQEDLDRQRASGMRRFENGQDQIVLNVVSDAMDKLSAINTAMANADLSERIALDDRRNSIRNSVLGILSNYAGGLSKVDNIKAMGRDARIAEATKRGAAGMVPASEFDYSTIGPGEFAGTGPFSSELPIFTYNKSRLE